MLNAAGLRRQFTMLSVVAALGGHPLQAQMVTSSGPTGGLHDSTAPDRGPLLAASGIRAELAAYATGPLPVPPSDIRQVQSSSLRDVAVAVYDPDGSVIYYNPNLIRAFGPELTAFFLAHERGHITLHHSRARWRDVAPEIRDSLLREQELEADCYAARTLHRSEPGAVQAAARFFGRMGERSYDRAHPSGARRAAWILACLPPVAGGAP